MSAITKGITKVALLVTVLIATFSATAQAQRFRGGFGGRVGPRWGFNLGVRPFYAPFWGPYYPYGAYPYAVRPTADVRVQVLPKQAEVFVDGFYAGRADDFDGAFKRLHTTPGGHAITLHLEGYRTVTQNIYVRPDSTFKTQDTMDKLAGVR